MTTTELNQIITANPESDSTQVQAEIRKVMSLLGTRGGKVKGKCKSRGDSKYYSKISKLRHG